MARGDPFVSIVINNHNYARFLSEAIDSALAQDYARVEVVVVDDGSTDESREIIRAYVDRIRAILKANGGQASALNEGIGASEGDLVMLLDADDVLLPEAASAAAAAWRPGVARIQFPLEATDGRGRPLGTRIPTERLPSGDLRSMVLAAGRYPGTGTTGAAYDRGVLDRLLPIPESVWRKQPDAYLLLLAPFCGEIVSLDRAHGRYRLHGANKWAMWEVTPERLREHLDGDARKEAMLRAKLPRFGARLPDAWLSRSVPHMQSRLASLRLDPAAHPHPDDRAWSLGWRGARAAVRSPFLSGRKRVLFAAWFLAVAVSPSRLARRLIDLAYGGARRNAPRRAPAR